MKRIVTIQDISCLGKCSLTVALPVISALGVETAIVPTAVLSTHTMFKGFTCKDLDDQILPIAEHWKSQGVTFDAFYTGYLASGAQIQNVIRLINDLKRPDDLVIIDPAMADHGKLYPAFDDRFPLEMAKLVAAADITLPNITEACLLTGTPYREEYDEVFAKEVVRNVAALGAKKVVLTGADYGGCYGVLYYDSASNSFINYYQERIEAVFHGTGDIFSSSFTGALLRGKPIEKAIEIAAEYTAECIRITMNSDEAKWYGVEFESAIPYLLKLCE